MGKDMTSRDGKVLVAQREDGADQFMVWVEYCGEEFRIMVGTRGQSTRDAFGSEWRVSCVTFGAPLQGEVVRVLSGDGVEQGLEEACASYFAGDRQLSDLLDLLDASGIAYVYAVGDENGVVWRPQPGECEPEVLAHA